MLTYEDFANQTDKLTFNIPELRDRDIYLPVEFIQPEFKPGDNIILRAYIMDTSCTDPETDANCQSRSSTLTLDLYDVRMKKMTMVDKPKPLEFSFKINDKGSMLEVQKGEVVCGYYNRKADVVDTVTEFGEVPISSLDSTERNDISDILGPATNSMYFQVTRKPVLQRQKQAIMETKGCASFIVDESNEQNRFNMKVVCRCNHMTDFTLVHRFKETAKSNMPKLSGRKPMVNVFDLKTRRPLEKTLPFRVWLAVMGFAFILFVMSFRFCGKEMLRKKVI
jgi:hypothetical protein